MHPWQSGSYSINRCFYNVYECDGWILKETGIDRMMSLQIWMLTSEQFN